MTALDGAMLGAKLDAVLGTVMAAERSSRGCAGGNAHTGTPATAPGWWGVSRWGELWHGEPPALLLPPSAPQPAPQPAPAPPSTPSIASGIGVG